MSLQHPFGELLAHFRARKPGLSQNRLAELSGYAPAILVRMCQGKKDLTGPSGRDRIIRIMGTLCDEGVQLTLDEANALLFAADLPPLFEELPLEAALIHRLYAPYPQKSPGTSRSNLLPALSTFIGRETEVNDLIDLVQRTRLVTLVGAGGVGKTRLAHEVATNFTANSKSSKLNEHFYDGIWLVEYSSVMDQQRVAATLAQTMGLPVSNEGSILVALQRQLRNKHLLLILDNCEHVINEVIELVSELLQHSPHVHVLATSREALRIPGESVWQVPSLTVPESIHVTPLRLLDFEAVRLFVRRAAELQRSFAINSDNAKAVAEICRHLDGIPLALELAAALVSMMSVQEIAQNLDHHLPLLSDGYRSAQPRHRTMRAALDWSYNLLEPAQQKWLTWLSVFVGGWTAEQAATVCGEAPEALFGLVRKSLVLAESHESGTRYRLLEPIRQYAAEKLQERDEEALARGRHLACFVDFAEQSDAGMMRYEIGLWEKRVLANFENLRTARTWSIAIHDCDSELRLVSALWRFWVLRARLREGLLWINAALQRCQALHIHSSQARACYGLATLYRYLRDYRRMMELAQASMALCQASNDRIGAAICLLLMAVGAQMDFDDMRESRYRQESMHILEETGDLSSLTNLLIDDAWSAIDRCNDVLAVQSLKRFLILSRRISDLNNIWTGLWWLAFVAYRHDDHPQAVQCLEESLRVSSELGVSVFTARSIELWGWMDSAQGLTRGNQHLQQYRDEGDAMGIAHLLLAVGRMYLDTGDYAEAEKLLTECVSLWDMLEPVGSEWGGPGWSCIELGHIARLKGNLATAAEQYEMALRRHVEAGSSDGIAAASLHLGHVALEQGNGLKAQACYRQSLEHYRDAGIRTGIGQALAGLANIANLATDQNDAMRLAGAASTFLIVDELKTMRAVERNDFEYCLRTLQARLSDATCAAIWGEGQAMMIKQAIALGLSF